MAGLFYLQIKLLFMLFDKFWDITGNIVSLNCFSSILKQKYITKAANSTNFHHFDDILYMVVEALTITLCIYIADYQIINSFQSWINKSNWPIFISKVEHNYLYIFKVDLIQKMTNEQIKAIIATTFAAKKEEWESL